MARGYVNEFCQPQETVEVEKTCDDDPSICSTDQLCGQSLTSKSGKADWRTDNASYVTEAKRRGLNCGVAEVVAKPANKPEGIFAKTHFAKLGRTQRKQLQYGLKQLGYYSSSIDGLWGKGTNAGVNVFAKDRNLSSNFPNSVFDALASEVAFENMPVSEKTTGNKNGLVCELENPEDLDLIEEYAGKRIFSGELARPNLRTITLLDDFLIYGEKKVRSLSLGRWRVRGQAGTGSWWFDLLFEFAPGASCVMGGSGSCSVQRLRAAFDPPSAASPW